MAAIEISRDVVSNPVVAALHEATERLGNAEGDVVFDFSAVHLLDVRTLRALEEFASRAQEKAITVRLRGVNVDVYKVLKLVGLTARFSFVS